MYAKIFTQMYDGTLCTQGPWQALVTFQQLLVLADPDGNVDMTPEAISRRTTIPLDIIQAGLGRLIEPDLGSRTPTEEGRRIVLLSEHRTWGWRIVNYKHYRDMKREEDRRAYHREYWHKRKAKTQQDSTHSTESTEEVDKRQEAEEEKYKDSTPRAKARRVPSPDFDGDNASDIAPKALVQLAQSFGVPQEWGEDAEALGFTPKSIMYECEKFRQYWTVGKGAGKRRTLKGWRQTWSNWLSKAAER